GTLIVKKVVINDNGGTKVASDFQFSVNGGEPVSFEGDGQNDLTVNAGSYTVTEPADSGYATTYDNCSEVRVPNGGTATCTVTNDDKTGTLIVKKVVINDNGGTKVASDFQFSVNVGELESFNANGENDLTVNAGSYTVTEQADSGYATTYDNCSEVEVPNGGTATCTVTNDDLPGTLIVKKVVINDDGGTKAASDFSFSVNGGDQQSFNDNGENDLTVDAGSYSVTEGSHKGYEATFDNCADVTVANGGTATCTITNNDAAVVIPAGSTTTPPTTVPVLPRTGSSTGSQAIIAVIAIGTGLALAMSRRRRRVA
ncbi:MAG TPA: LPXTG cell wall anchor domain-containing protein, partial [Acidimicrobiia bacterium]|nr:LPXTG cell wall anchor domain-containing protein [Acidimicrobiia bacterium]